MISHSHIVRRLYNLADYHLIKYLFENEANKHIVVLRQRQNKPSSKVTASSDCLFVVSEIENILTGTKYGGDGELIHLKELSPQIPT